MLSQKLFDELSHKISETLAASPAKDIEKNVRSLMGAAFTKMDLVTREEFDVQQEVLARTREQLAALETRLTELEANVDSLIVVLNEKLIEVLGNDITQEEAFAHANDVLKNAVGGIAEIINEYGQINVDFEDVKTVMGEPGKAMMGTAMASGPDRARIAAEQAVACPLLEGIRRKTGDRQNFTADAQDFVGGHVDLTALAGIGDRQQQIVSIHRLHGRQQGVHIAFHHRVKTNLQQLPGKILCHQTRCANPGHDNAPG